ncbi:MAG TPA: hypothetical protein VGE47_04130, partial [Burkholderiaceae bacterium]
DLAQSFATVRPRLIEALSLTGLQLWWDEGDGVYHCVGEKSRLSAASLSTYLAALGRSTEPLCLESSSEHPFAQELGNATAPQRSRLEVGLRSGGRLSAFLWLLREPGDAWSRVDTSRALRLAGLLERMLAMLDQAQARAQAPAPERLRELAARAQQLAQLATDPSTTPAALAAQLAQLADELASLSSPTQSR